MNFILRVSLPQASSSPRADAFTDYSRWRHVRTFRFGPFLLQPERQLLMKVGVPVRIGGRALDLLTLLVERAGELVSKRELMSRAWPDTFVEEGNLKVNIAGLRRALGESPAAPRFIATVVGRGYRFVAPVGASALPSNRDVGLLPGGDGLPSYPADTVSTAQSERLRSDQRGSALDEAAPGRHGHRLGAVVDT